PRQIVLLVKSFRDPLTYLGKSGDDRIDNMLQLIAYVLGLQPLDKAIHEEWTLTEEPAPDLRLHLFRHDLPEGGIGVLIFDKGIHDGIRELPLQSSAFDNPPQRLPDAVPHRQIVLRCRDGGDGSVQQLLKLLPRPPCEPIRDVLPMQQSHRVLMQPRGNVAFQNL